MYNKIKYSFLKNRLKTPIYLIFFVTSKCNGSCRHCFYHQELNSAVDDLSLAEIDTFSSRMGKLVWLSYSGGEPFLRDDLYETYRIFVKNNAVDHIAIPTNGILTDRIYDVCRQILEDNRVRSLTLNLSLDGPLEIHEKTRGAGSYDHLIRTYQALAPLKEKYQQFSIMAATILTRQNYAYINQLDEQIRTQMPGVDYHNFEIARGFPPDNGFRAPGTEELKQIREKIFAVWKRYDYYASPLQARIADRAKKILYDQYIDILEGEKQPWPCLAGSVHAVVDYKGDVSFCEGLPALGNLRKQSFLDIWGSDEADTLRSKVKNNCSCCHSCFQITNLIFCHKYWPRLII